MRENLHQFLCRQKRDSNVCSSVPGRCFKVVEDRFLRLSDIEHPADEELEVICGKLYADFYTKRCGKWALLRDYRLGGYLAHRLLFNGTTWADFKKLQ
jgi:hypothetical protein